MGIGRAEARGNRRNNFEKDARQCTCSRFVITFTLSGRLTPLAGAGATPDGGHQRRELLRAPIPASDIRISSGKEVSLHAPVCARARQQTNSEPECWLPKQMQGGGEWTAWLMSLSEVCVPRPAGVAEDGLRRRSAPPLRRLCTGAWPVSELQS